MIKRLILYGTKDFSVQLTKYLPGLTIVAAVTVASLLIQSTPFFSRVLPLSSLLIAIILGMILRNIIPLPLNTQPGIRFSSKKILRLAIIFLGFKLSISQLIQVGPSAIITILIVSTSTIIFTFWLGQKMGVSRDCALLLGSGVSICGASAIAAVDAVVKSKEEDTAFAIGAITVFGTIFMFLYPFLYELFHIPDLVYALWAGTSIHEVAQVAAAGEVAVGSFEAMASTVKMIRVLFIIPLTIFLTLTQWKSTQDKGTGADSHGHKGKINIPWFAILFFVMVLINSSAYLPKEVTVDLVNFDNWIMTAAMAGLGLDLSLNAMKKVGRQAIILGTVSSVFISLLSAVVIGVLISVGLIH